MKWIDLSHKITEDISVYPSDPKISIKLEKDIKKDRSRLHSFCMGTHTGTHVDAASHIIQDGKSLHEYPISSFTGTAVKVKNDSIDILKRNKQKFNGVILETGWHKYFDDPDKFFSPDRPLINEELIEVLVEKKIRFFGCDLPSVDKSGSKKKPIHNKLLRSNIVIYESLARLHLIPKHKKIKFYGFPLPFHGFDGSPVRVICSI